MDEVPAVPPYISERYKVGRMLGDGNFAVVRECVEHSTGREYALKIINKGKCRGKVNDPKKTKQRKDQISRFSDLVYLTRLFTSVLISFRST